VLAYAALAEEADPAALVTELRARGVRTALPTVAGPGVLTLSWVDAATPLVPGPFGIGQPATKATFASPDDFDLVIVPGLAFDRNCRRIGFGGGFYDALLPTLRPGALAVGIAFDEQLIDRVPCEAHDVPVDVVVTPGGVFRRGD
jgi:5-formyltetrahydrofolate cyclo-ligase